MKQLTRKAQQLRTLQAQIEKSASSNQYEVCPQASSSRELLMSMKGKLEGGKSRMGLKGKSVSQSVSISANESLAIVSAPQHSAIEMAENIVMQEHFEDFVQQLSELDLPKQRVGGSGALQQQWGSKFFEQYVRRRSLADGHQNFDLSHLLQIENAKDAALISLSQQQLWRNLAFKYNNQNRLLASNRPDNAKDFVQIKSDSQRTDSPLRQSVSSVKLPTMHPKLEPQAAEPYENKTSILQSASLKWSKPRNSHSVLPILFQSSNMIADKQLLQSPKPLLEAQRLEMSQGDKLRQKRVLVNMREHRNSLAKQFNSESCSPDHEVVTLMALSPSPDLKQQRQKSRNNGSIDRLQIMVAPNCQEDTRTVSGLTLEEQTVGVTSEESKRAGAVFQPFGQKEGRQMQVRNSKEDKGKIDLIDNNKSSMAQSKDELRFRLLQTFLAKNIERAQNLKMHLRNQEMAALGTQLIRPEVSIHEKTDEWCPYKQLDSSPPFAVKGYRNDRSKHQLVLAAGENVLLQDKRSRAIAQSEDLDKLERKHSCRSRNSQSDCSPTNSVLKHKYPDRTSHLARKKKASPERSCEKCSCEGHKKQELLEQKRKSVVLAVKQRKVKLNFGRHIHQPNQALSKLWVGNKNNRSVQQLATLNPESPNKLAACNDKDKDGSILIKAKDFVLKQASFGRRLPGLHVDYVNTPKNLMIRGESQKQLSPLAASTMAGSRPKHFALSKNSHHANSRHQLNLEPQLEELTPVTSKTMQEQSEQFQLKQRTRPVMNAQTQASEESLESNSNKVGPPSEGSRTQEMLGSAEYGDNMNQMPQVYLHVNNHVQPARKSNAKLSHYFNLDQSFQEGAPLASSLAKALEEQMPKDKSPKINILLQLFQPEQTGQTLKATETLEEKRTHLPSHDAYFGQGNPARDVTSVSSKFVVQGQKCLVQSNPLPMARRLGPDSPQNLYVDGETELKSPESSKPRAEMQTSSIHDSSSPVAKQSQEETARRKEANNGRSRQLTNKLFKSTSTGVTHEMRLLALNQDFDSIIREQSKQLLNSATKQQNSFQAERGAESIEKVQTRVTANKNHSHILYQNSNRKKLKAQQVKMQILTNDVFNKSNRQLNSSSCLNLTPSVNNSQLSQPQVQNEEKMTANTPLNKALTAMAQNQMPCVSLRVNDREHNQTPIAAGQNSELCQETEKLEFTQRSFRKDKSVENDRVCQLPSGQILLSNHQITSFPASPQHRDEPKILNGASGQTLRPISMQEYRSNNEIKEQQSEQSGSNK